MIGYINRFNLLFNQVVQDKMLIYKESYKMSKYKTNEDPMHEISEWNKQYLENSLRYVKDLRKPCAIMINTFVSREQSNASRFMYSSTVSECLKITNLLREKGIDAVPIFSEEASDPSKTIVSATGIQTPVLRPRQASKAAKEIMDIIYTQKNNWYLNELGMAMPVEIEQFAPVSYTSKNFYKKTLEPDLNPKAAQVREKYGFDLEYEICKSALDSSKLIQASKLCKQKGASITKLYRGGSLGDNPYAILTTKEGKSLAYATPDVGTALMYTGVSGSYGSTCKAVSSLNNDSIKFGFLYEYAPDKNIVLFKDWDIEQGHLPEKDLRPEHTETPVFPQKNKLNNIYLHLRKDGQDVLYPLDLENKKHKAFLELYSPADTSCRGYMIERRNKILGEQKVHQSYKSKFMGIFNKKLEPYTTKLSLEEVQKISNITIEEIKAKQRQEQQINQAKVRHLSDLRGALKPQPYNQVAKISSEKNKQIKLAVQKKDISR